MVVFTKIHKKSVRQANGLNFLCRLQKKRPNIGIRVSFCIEKFRRPGPGL
jgi:hypothetical protein